ncbi:phosphoenolpyruvate carboxykinase (ATP) [Catenovulum sediminis]|uniref:Phosphoenolpyruvate carboxykinase (ATP) n=1 Tax=Catenovulum sediminis TaxID=1740262 RepID=A0ABV1RHE7_9ALTE|nr:phosphoenolpyruvate carboxykinase (ATP) [Catenovulum sediminis]
MHAHFKPYVSLTAAELIEHAIQNNEGRLTASGALAVSTGSRTGRSPLDRFIVKEPETKDKIDWGKINKPFSANDFENLWFEVHHYLQSQPHYLGNYQVGADEENCLEVEVLTQTAWHQLFAHNMFIRKRANQTSSGSNIQKLNWQVLNAPGFTCHPDKHGTHSDGAVIIDFASQRVLLAGMPYAGEMKKALFSVQNFLLAEHDILPMHCSANAETADKTSRTALYFGLSGTGKTTLSADPKRYLIGDDEHGWSRNGIFNLEGGCYAKCIDLSEKQEPLIWYAIKFGAVLENVVLDKERIEKYEDDSLTANTRVSYPLEHIPKRVTANKGGHPSAVIFLTCDLSSVLPPIAILDQYAAAYHFLSGYTALVGSTEIGSQAAIGATFSTCFGAPFFPRPAADYANLLIKRLTETNTPVYLVNTGWTGGPYPNGRRFSIDETRAVISAIVEGKIDKDDCRKMEIMNLTVPNHLNGLDETLLWPEKNWHNPVDYRSTALQLANRFIDNFKQYQVDEKIRQAGPSGAGI